MKINSPIKRLNKTLLTFIILPGDDIYLLTNSSSLDFNRFFLMRLYKPRAINDFKKELRAVSELAQRNIVCNKITFHDVSSVKLR